MGQKFHFDKSQITKEMIMTIFDKNEDMVIAMGLDEDTLTAMVDFCGMVAYGDAAGKVELIRRKVRAWKSGLSKQEANILDGVLTEHRFANEVLLRVKTAAIDTLDFELSGSTGVLHHRIVERYSEADGHFRLSDLGSGKHESSDIYISARLDCTIEGRSEHMYLQYVIRNNVVVNEFMGHWTADETEEYMVFDKELGYFVRPNNVSKSINVNIPAELPVVYSWGLQCGVVVILRRRSANTLQLVLSFMGTNVYTHDFKEHIPGLGSYRIEDHCSRVVISDIYVAISLVEDIVGDKPMYLHMAVKVSAGGEINERLFGNWGYSGDNPHVEFSEEMGRFIDVLHI